MIQWLNRHARGLIPWWLGAEPDDSGRNAADSPGEAGDQDDSVNTVWETDAEGRNYYQSPSWYEYVGKGPGSSFGEDWLAFYHPDDRELLVREWRRSLKSEGAHVYDIQVRIRRFDGTYHWFRVAGAPIRDSSGAVTKWVGTCTSAPEPRKKPTLPIGPEGEKSLSYRILVADDNPDSAESLRRILEMTGHDVKVAHDGHRALAIARQTRPQIVFLDIVLPGIDGYTLARMLRRELGQRDVRIFAVSGFPQENGQGALEAGFDKYFVKPMDPEFILSMLSRGKRKN